MGREVKWRSTTQRRRELIGIIIYVIIKERNVSVASEAIMQKTLFISKDAMRNKQGV